MSSNTNFKNNFYWFFSRLRTISFTELYYRGYSFFSIRLQVIAKYFHSEQNILATKKEKVLNIIDKKLVNIQNLKIFNYNFVFDGPINWNSDLYYNNDFPIINAHKIDIRTPKYGSAKHVWEINRFLFLPHLAINNILFKEQADISPITNLLMDWDYNNPYLKGVNWYSNIEVNIRLINLFLTDEIIYSSEQNLIYEDLRTYDKVISRIVEKHIRFSVNNLSKYSSANNHLISEYTGQFIATSKWTFYKFRHINSKAKAGLEREILKQHTSTGINREEAADYIQFIADMFLLSFIVAEKNNNSFSREYQNKLYDILTYINTFLDINLNHPRYGDNDDGRLFILDESQYTNNFQHILNAGAILFKEPNFKKTLTLDQKNRILFGNSGEDIFNQLVIPEYCLCLSKFYENDGHFFFKRIIQKKELYIHFDAAPLGFLSIAAHGHADALSFVLHYNGHEVFCDPGTFCYHTDPEWRQYFTGTSAHNTVTINGISQAKYIGPTLWLAHYSCKTLSFGISPELEFVRAEHNGYYKSEKVLHQRMLSIDMYNEITIEDYIINHSNDSKQINIYFHFHPAILPKLDNFNVTLSTPDDSIINMVLDNRLQWRIANGELDPILGWYSPSFYKKFPTNVLVGSISTQDNILIKTKISIS